MSATLEREIKLRFADAAAARAAVARLGLTPKHPRRLQDDCLFDTADDGLRRQRSALRVRTDQGRTLLTFKGPPLPSLMKVREEVETAVADGERLVEILTAVGFRASFRCQKYREEFAADNATVAIDETPIGVFVEIEGDNGAIVTIALALGYGPPDYVVESYRTLFVRDCERRGVSAAHMLFDSE